MAMEGRREKRKGEPPAGCALTHVIYRPRIG